MRLAIVLFAVSRLCLKSKGPDYNTFSPHYVLVESLPDNYSLTMMDEKTGRNVPNRGFHLRRYLRFPRTFAEVKKMGWKFVLLFILFYLIRDSILYLLIPYLIYKGVIAP